MVHNTISTLLGVVFWVQVYTRVYYLYEMFISIAVCLHMFEKYICLLQSVRMARDAYNSVNIVCFCVYDNNCFMLTKLTMSIHVAFCYHHGILSLYGK